MNCVLNENEGFGSWRGKNSIFQVNELNYRMVRMCNLRDTEDGMQGCRKFQMEVFESKRKNSAQLKMFKEIKNFLRFNIDQKKQRTILKE